MAGGWTVSEVARLAHVTVRTLHHYDEIGLLVPSQRTEAGYRMYGPPELERLQQILLFRELSFSLEAIQELLEQPAFERLEALRAQRELLFERIARTESVIGAVDVAIEALQGGTEMDEERMFAGFGDFDQADHAEEARERWGDTDAYRESMRRAKRYTKEDWTRIKAEADGIEARWVTLMEGRGPADAAHIAEEYRLHIDRWFYPLSRAGHVKLAELYTSDARFEQHYEKRAAGLAAYVAASIRANAQSGRGTHSDDWPIPP